MPAKAVDLRYECFLCMKFLEKLFLLRFIALAIFVLTSFTASSQARGKYYLVIHPDLKDSLFDLQPLKLQTVFNTEPEITTYISKLPSLLNLKGFPLASVDSVWVNGDSTHIILYPGRQYQWMNLSQESVDLAALETVGFNENMLTAKPMNIGRMMQLQQKLLDYYENNGYPFARVWIDSINISGDSIAGKMKIDKGLLYKIDSTRVIGKIKLNKKFLQKYLDIPNGSVYSKQKLSRVDKRILELPYVTTVQPSDITMLGSGSVLNLYLQAKKSSQVNFLVGLLPAAGDAGKFQLTGDINLDLKNILGSGEGFLLKWQQLQPKSPRLNLGYDQPYIFNSPLGLSTLFELFKKDSNFLQLNAQAGLIFDLGNNQSGKLYGQWQRTTLLTGAVDTNQIKFEKKLPVNIDVSSVNAGINYEVNATNYRFNPRKGNEINLVSVVGVKTIERNNDILSIRDPSFNFASLYDTLKAKSYQLRLKLAAAHYFPAGKSATFKTAINSGLYSSPSIFRNELFQIGGYRLLRGFDEESIYATRYAVFTAEYRYIINLNSYIYGFTDVGFTKNQYQSLNVNNQFIGAGLGILFERKAGLINMSVALGKRNDLPFNLRQAAKIHFGYINYF